MNSISNIPRRRMDKRFKIYRRCTINGQVIIYSKKTIIDSCSISFTPPPFDPNNRCNKNDSGIALNGYRDNKKYRKGK